MHVNNFVAGNLKLPLSFIVFVINKMKPKSVENYTGMVEPFGDEMPNFGICGTVFKDTYAKTETADSSENSWRKSTENEQLEILHKHSICTGVSP